MSRAPQTFDTATIVRSAVDAYATALRERLEHQAARIKGLRQCARAMRGGPKQTELWAA